jgi:hypothetical protein
MPSQGLKHWFPHLPSALERAPMAGLMCAGALLLGVTLAGARYSNSNKEGAASTADTAANSAARPADENPEATARIHEGDELVDQAGQFRISGDRVVFVTADGQHRLPALENLPLERVANAIDGNPAQLEWIVSGKVTEYRGANYLLLTRAQRSSELPPTESKP